MTKERLILLDTILSEENVDIGRLIAREIYTCTTKTKGFLFFPCLITELCLKASVPIAANEQKKFLSNNLNAEMKERLRKVRGPLPMPMPMPAMQEHFMQKQAAVWKFQNEQHDWLQLVFQYLSTELGNIEAPVFPSWVLRTEGKEEEEKEEADEKEEEKEEEQAEEQKSKKRVTRKQLKGKKKVVVEPVLEEIYDSEDEDEQLEKEMDKESEEEEESDNEVDSEEEERARGVILEEIARQKYTKTSESAPQETTHTSPIHSPTREASPQQKSPLTDQAVQSPPQETPPPPSPTIEQEKTAHTEQTISEPSPVIPETEPEQTMPSSPSNITANVISALEKEFVQEREEEEGLDKDEDPTEEEEPEAVEETEAVKQAIEMQADAPASDASASQPTAAMKPKHDEATIKLVLEQMAQQKREALGNTQAFFKTPALKKQAVKTPKRKISEAISTDATASVTASVPDEQTTSTTPKSKSKKQKPFTPPTRQSSRTRSGAKK